MTLWNANLADQGLQLTVLTLPPPMPTRSGAKKGVLSGQHGVAALKLLRKEYLVKDLPLPDWLQVVNAKVMAPNTSVNVRHLRAGDDHFA